jgi:pimeloyl-ACP methyl ester carboxylesterase
MRTSIAAFSIAWAVSLVGLAVIRPRAERSGLFPQAGRVPYSRHEKILPLGDDTEPLRYTVYVPGGEANEPPPLLLALHYGGERPPSIGKDFVEGVVLPGLAELRPIVAAPVCPGRDWRDPLSEQAVLKLLDAVRAVHPVSGLRACVIGFSMGAIGAYFLATRHPDLFSAIVAMAGIPEAEDESLLAGASGAVPIYAVLAGADEIFPLDRAKSVLDKLRERAIPLEMDVLPEVTHYQTGRFVPALRRAVPWLRKIWGPAGRRED